MPANNYKGALKTSGTTLQNDMAAFDQLPESLRHMVQDFVIELSAETVLAFYQSILRQARDFGGSDYEAEVYTQRKLQQVEALELDQSGAAVEVSVLRYGARQ